jgi:hypothetical protein
MLHSSIQSKKKRKVTETSIAQLPARQSTKVVLVEAVD